MKFTTDGDYDTLGGFTGYNYYGKLWFGFGKKIKKFKKCSKLLKFMRSHLTYGLLPTVHFGRSTAVRIKREKHTTLVEDAPAFRQAQYGSLKELTISECSAEPCTLRKGQRISLKMKFTT
ncbi:hypothetical protein T265_15087, partial [Opisthorchis viverrini]